MLPGGVTTWPPSNAVRRFGLSLVVLVNLGVDEWSSVGKVQARRSRLVKIAIPIGAPQRAGGVYHRKQPSVAERMNATRSTAGVMTAICRPLGKDDGYAAPAIPAEIVGVAKFSYLDPPYVSELFGGLI